MGPAGAGGKQARCRLDARGRHGGQVASRRLHLADGCGASHHCAKRLHETPVPLRARLRACQRDRCCAQHGCRECGSPRQDHRRIRGAGQGTAWQAELRDGRRRHGAPPDRRNVQAASRRRLAAHPLQGKRACRFRPCRRPDPAHVRHGDVGIAAGQGRQNPRARGDDGKAVVRVARCPDALGNGPARIRCRDLVWHPGSRRNATRRH